MDWTRTRRATCWTTRRARCRLFQNAPGGIITDDHYYVNQYAGIPMIDIIHYDMSTGTGFPSVWHTVGDNIDAIDRNTLGVVGATLLQVIKNEE